MRSTFRIDHGPLATNRYTVLIRQQVPGKDLWIWQDPQSPMGFGEDIDGYPVDAFGLRISGDFVEPV